MYRLFLLDYLYRLLPVQANDRDRTIPSARVESCRGCSLNRLPDVKKFIYLDLPLYKNVEFTAIQGAPPELVLLSAASEEICRLPLSHLNRLECNELLEMYGFQRSDSNKNEAEDEEDRYDKSEF